MSAVHETWTGPAVGGPLHDEELVSWGGKGMLVVHEATRETWVYDWDGACFTARATGPLDADKLAQAQEDGGRAIRVIE